jgi:hypothetical protein
MTQSRKFIVCASAALALAAGLSMNGTNRLADGALFSEAQARVGRPLTPMSYAGMARRTTRLAVAVAQRRVRREPIMARPACRSWTPTPGSQRAADAMARGRLAPARFALECGREAVTLVEKA